MAASVFNISISQPVPAGSSWLSHCTGLYVKPTNTPVISGSGGINKSRFCGLKPNPSSFCCSALWVPAQPSSWGFGGACCRSGITTKRWNEEHRWGPARGAGKIQQLPERGCETWAVQASTPHSLNKCAFLPIWNSLMSLAHTCVFAAGASERSAIWVLQRDACLPEPGTTQITCLYLTAGGTLKIQSQIRCSKIIVAITQ